MFGTDLVLKSEIYFMLGEIIIKGPMLQSSYAMRVFSNFFFELLHYYIYNVYSGMLRTFLQIFYE